MHYPDETQDDGNAYIDTEVRYKDAIFYKLLVATLQLIFQKMDKFRKGVSIDRKCLNYLNLVLSSDSRRVARYN